MGAGTSNCISDNQSTTVDKQFQEFDQRYIQRRVMCYSNTGKISEVQDLLLERLVAIKEIDSITNILMLDEEDQVQNEVEVNKKLDYPNFQRMIEQVLHNNTLKVVYESQPQSCNLYQYQQKKNLSIYTIQQIFRTLTQTLNQMNTIDMAHCDICPENIMIIENNTGLTGSASKENPTIQVKLIGLNKTREVKPPEDLDHSKQSLDEDDLDRPKDDEPIHVMYGISGSYFYTAPEMLTTMEFSKQADVFSLGVLVFWLLTGDQPYEPITKEGQADMLAQKISNLALLDKAPNKLKSIIVEMLNPDPAVRVSMEDLLECEWCVEVEKLSFLQMKKMVVDEEIEYKILIEKLMNIKFSNKLCRLIYFQLSEQYYDRVSMLKAGKLFQKIDRNSDGKITETELGDQILRYQSGKDIEKYRNKIFTNIDINNSMTLEFSEFKVCGMSFKFEEITSKLIRLFKLATRPNKQVSISEVMEAMQDGMTNYEWFKSRMDDLDSGDHMIDREEYLLMIRQMVGDLKKYAQSGDKDNQEDEAL